MNNRITIIRNHIKAGETGLARPVLTTALSESNSERQKALQILATQPDEVAFDLLSFATNKEYKTPEISRQLRQLVINRAYINFNFALILLYDTDEGSMFNACDLFKHILSNGTDKELLSQIIRKAGEIRFKDLTDDIAEFIFFDDEDLKHEAVIALAKFGTPLAHQKLIQASKTSKCDQNILDTLAMFEKQGF